MRIVDDDVSWSSISTTKLEKEEEEDDGDLPVVCIFLFFWPSKGHAWESPRPRIEPTSQQWIAESLTTRLPGNSSIFWGCEDFEV